ncbi:60S ribosomal protein L34 [Tanacetum coccineum]
MVTLSHHLSCIKKEKNPQFHDLEFEGMTVIRLSKLLQGTCMFPVKGIFFLIPGKELSNGLIEIKNDLDLANCIAVGYKNGKVVDMFLEHHGYDLSHWIQTDIDNNDDELSDVEMEDIIGYGASDFVGEDDVVIPNRSINDPFLNKLCNGSYINDFSDKSDVGESSQPCGKELEIDSDDEDVDKQLKLVEGVIYPEFDPKLPWNEMKPTLGLRFEHPEQLKECMTNYGVANGYQLWYRRNDYRSLFVLCGRELGEGRSGGKKGKKGDWPYKKEKNEGELPKKDKGVLLRSPTKGKKRAYIRSPSKKGVQGQSSADKGKAEDLQGESVAKKGKKKGTKKGVNGCTFRLWASWMQDGSCFQIKTLIPEHTCSRNFELGSLVTFKWIAKQFALKIIEDPTITYRSIQEQIKKKYLINVSVGQCKRAKQRALFDHEGGLIEHYSRLWDYRKQLLDTNPGSSVHLHVDELDNGKIHFKRIYVCFKAMIEGWSAGCRKVIGLDGCFLKGTCRNMQSVETIDNWEWFLACLCEDLRLDSGASLTVISDGHKGLMESVKNLLPHAEHRQCARHIYANFKKKWNGLHFKSLFWLAATTTIQHTFYSKMNLIGNIDPEAKQWLVDRNPNSWCRAFFKMDRGCAAYENGISESYHNAIRIARGSWLCSASGQILQKSLTFRCHQSLERCQTSQKTAKIIEDAIATGKLKTAGLKRRCKSERIAKRAKPFQFGKDGAGSCADKAWDVDEVLAEE